MEVPMMSTSTQPNHTAGATLPQHQSAQPSFPHTTNALPPQSHKQQPYHPPQPPQTAFGYPAPAPMGPPPVLSAPVVLARI
eukprot:8241319-Pyramimonas_sp.AAC.2